MTPYAFEDFVRDLGDTIKQVADSKMLVDAVSEHVRRLLSGPFFLDDEALRPVLGTFTSQLLHRDPSDRFVVVACAWAPQQSTPIHDHPSWGVIAGVTNRVVATHYRRNDDGDIPGFADVSEVSRVLISETAFAQLRPPDESIHRIENPYRDPAVTFHVFGSASPWVNSFDPPAKTLTPFEPSAETIGM